MQTCPKNIKDGWIQKLLQMKRQIKWSKMPGADKQFILEGESRQVLAMRCTRSYYNSSM